MRARPRMLSIGASAGRTGTPNTSRPLNAVHHRPVVKWSSFRGSSAMLLAASRLHGGAWGAEPPIQTVGGRVGPHSAVKLRQFFFAHLVRQLAHDDHGQNLVRGDLRLVPA